MNKALLLDLDDTLLRDGMEDFLPRYFGALMEAVSHLMPPQLFLEALHHATRQMMVNTDALSTNAEIFWYEFEPMLEIEREQLEPVLERFYDEIFPALNEDEAAVAVEGAHEVVEAAREASWKLAVATNPVFPKQAILHRLKWAGLDEASFDLVTSYENMHATKPHAQYFAQIAQSLGVEPASCVMAGNHIGNDLVGAAEVGMRTFWVNTYPVEDVPFKADAEGTLLDLHEWLFGRYP